MHLSRRSIIGGAVSVAVTPIDVLGAPVTNSDPRARAEGLVKLQGDLDPSRTTPWWYEVAIYAVVGDAAPRLLIRAEGCETYRMQRQPGGGFRSTGVTVTAFKDAERGDWIDRFDNPYTGRMDVVRPNLITGSTTFYPPDGSVPLPSSPPGQPPAAGWIRWSESGDRVCCTLERRATGAIQPIMETASLWTDRATLLDPAASRVEAVVTSTYASPWLGWMEMAGRPGHLLWVSTGRKLRSFDELPDGYRRRAEKLAPGRLAPSQG